MVKLFGTDGIRGKAGEFPLDMDTVAKIGHAFSEVFTSRLGRPARFVSGRDTRESGPDIETAFHYGARLGDAEGESAGVITTPGVAFITKENRFDAGIVISASHNPYQDNGIKIFLPTGQKLDEESEREIEAIVSESVVTYTPKDSIRLGDKSMEFARDYFEYLRDKFAHLDLSRLKIAADCANGAATSFAPELLRALGADVAVINAEPNGRNINGNCGSLHLEHLQQAVLDNEADFGVAFDGDADRSLFVDEKGSVVDGDATLWILANHLKKQRKLKSGQVVATVMSNIGLETALRGEGIELIRASVGDKYVLEELLRTGAEIGGEQSGHIILPKTSLVGDGMMTALFVLDALVNSGGTFSELHSGFIQSPQTLVNVRVKSKPEFDLVPVIAAAADKLRKQLGSDGRLLVRYSGTENLARVMIEGKDQSEIERLAKSLAAVIEKEIG